MNFKLGETTDYSFLSCFFLHLKSTSKVLVSCWANNEQCDVMSISLISIWQIAICIIPNTFLSHAISDMSVPYKDLSLVMFVPCTFLSLVRSVPCTFFYSQVELQLGKWTHRRTDTDPFGLFKLAASSLLKSYSLYLVVYLSS